MNSVSTPVRARFICAMISSDSKSDTTRRPFTMKSASELLGELGREAGELGDRDVVGRWATDSSIIAWRSSRSNRASPFCGLRTAATITSSK